MPDDKSYPASPGPDIALRQSDAEFMQRAMKGVTVHRAEGIAHQVAERQMTKDAKPKDMPFMTHTRKRVMSGRRHPDQVNDLNCGLNVGSTHLQMPAETHNVQNIKEPPVEGQVTLPKDQ